MLWKNVPCKVVGDLKLQNTYTSVFWKYKIAVIPVDECMVNSIHCGVLCLPKHMCV